MSVFYSWYKVCKDDVFENSKFYKNNKHTMKGNINIQTENIFPIIKKFLYSDHEIFLRELVSNAVDATQKLKALVSLGQAQTELGDLTIELKIDKDNKQLIFSDKGLGMTEEEVKKYINQIAFSGAEDFLKKYEGKVESNLIGHFGLGFYSAFMVAEKVEIQTKSHADAPAVRWTCDGSPEFTLDEIEKTERGTDIILHIAEDSVEFLEESRILSLLQKYCRFMPIPIRFGNEKTWENSETEKDDKGEPKRIEIEKPRIINNPNPAWKRKPADLTDEDYKTFYHELYPMQFEEPLFQIHLNVDYPFNLTGILYFPKVKKNIDPNRNKIQLYCNQVFVTDSVEGIVPEYLMLLHGVLDSPDIPLNVSRSYLQSDASVKKISAHISKKVADKLDELFNSNREDFESKWDDIKLFIQYGMLSEEKFYERAQKFCLLKNTEGKYATFEEYRKQVEPLQTNKTGEVICLYANDAEVQHAYIQKAKDKGYDVLLMDGFLDSHFLNLLEQKLEKTRFVRVDGDTIDKLIEKEEALPAKLSQEEQDSLKTIIENEVDKTRFFVQMESLSETEQPMQITQNEFMRRYKEMSAMGGGGMAGLYGELPESYNLVVNVNHPLISEVLNEKDGSRQTELIKQLADLALLSNGLLKGAALTDFVSRSLKIIK